MPKPVILLLGANGQLGFELFHTLTALGTVVARDFPEIDFAIPESLREHVRSVKPAIVVNAAAYTAVDKAESDSEKAFAVNAAAPAVLAEETEKFGGIFVHYSTDYVFDGTKTTPYSEVDVPNPLSVYGRTKHEGERGATQCSKHIILRTSWVVGRHGANFLKTMLKLAGERSELRVVADQRGAPTSAQLLAENTATVLQSMDGATGSDPRWGLYHLTASGETNWNQLARRTIEIGMASGLPLKASSASVAEIRTADYPTPAKRPLNSRLDTAKFRKTFGQTLPDWTVGVDRVLSQIVGEMRQ